MDSVHGSGIGIGRGGSGGGGENTSVISRGGASADAWSRLVCSGVEDDLVGAVGGGTGLLSYEHFLNACFLCRKSISNNGDIFMYRGDIPFCSEECRKEHIEMDEEIETKEKNTTRSSHRGRRLQGTWSPHRGIPRTAPGQSSPGDNKQPLKN